MSKLPVSYKHKKVKENATDILKKSATRSAIKMLRISTSWTPLSVTNQFDYDMRLANPSFPVLVIRWDQCFFHLHPWKLGKPYGFWSFQELEKLTFTQNGLFTSTLSHTCLVCNPTVLHGITILTSCLYWHIK